MNIVVRSFLMFAVVLGAGANALAKNKNAVPDSDCYVKQVDAYMSWNKFFSWVSQQSKGNQCSYGRIASSPNTGRVYINGKKVGSDASVSESKAIIKDYGFNRGCETYTCEETKLIVVDPSNPQLPAQNDPEVTVVVPVPTVVVPMNQSW